MTVHYPDDLAESFGYNRDARYVAFYIQGSELICEDGRSMFTAGSETSQHFIHNHRLLRYSIGNDMEDAINHLLIDRKTNILYVGESREVKKFITGQTTRKKLT